MEEPPDKPPVLSYASGAPGRSGLDWECVAIAAAGSLLALGCYVESDLARFLQVAALLVSTAPLFDRLYRALHIAYLRWRLRRLVRRQDALVRRITSRCSGPEPQVSWSRLVLRFGRGPGR